MHPHQCNHRGFGPFIHLKNTKIMNTQEKKKPSAVSSIEIWGSVFGKSEAETVCENIIKILKTNGDEWRELPWEEYEAARTAHGATPRDMRLERPYFDQVLPYTTSATRAALICREFNEVLE